jgi:hypothetical protein
MKFPLTPRDATTGERLALQISAEHALKIMKAGLTLSYRGVIQDLKTGKWYRIKGAPCGATGCNCDAIAIAIAPETVANVDGRE